MFDGVCAARNFVEGRRQRISECLEYFPDEGMWREKRSDNGYELFGRSLEQINDRDGESSPFSALQRTGGWCEPVREGTWSGSGVGLANAHVSSGTRFASLSAEGLLELKRGRVR